MGEKTLILHITHTLITIQRKHLTTCSLKSSTFIHYKHLITGLEAWAVHNLAMTLKSLV